MAIPARAIEFIGHYLDMWKARRPMTLHVWLGDLALASLNQLCEIRDLTPTEQILVGRLVREQRGDQAGNLARWAVSGCRPLVQLITDAILTEREPEPPALVRDYFGRY